MMLLQSSKHAIIYTWYHLNKEEVSAKYCKNLNKPELLCSGKCYIRTVIEADNKDEQAATSPLTSILNYLNTELFITANPHSLTKLVELGALENLDNYSINYSFLLIHYIFHPPD